MLRVTGKDSKRMFCNSRLQHIGLGVATADTVSDTCDQFSIDTQDSHTGSTIDLTQFF